MFDVIAIRYHATYSISNISRGTAGGGQTFIMLSFIEVMSLACRWQCVHDPNLMNVARHAVNHKLALPVIFFKYLAPTISYGKHTNSLVLLFVTKHKCHSAATWGWKQITKVSKKATLKIIITRRFIAPTAVTLTIMNLGKCRI